MLCSRACTRSAGSVASTGGPPPKRPLTAARPSPCTTRSGPASSGPCSDVHSISVSGGTGSVIGRSWRSRSPRAGGGPRRAPRASLLAVGAPPPVGQGAQGAPGGGEGTQPGRTGGAPAVERGARDQEPRDDRRPREQPADRGHVPRVLLLAARRRRFTGVYEPHHAASVVPRIVSGIQVARNDRAIRYHSDRPRLTPARPRRRASGAPARRRRTPRRTRRRPPRAPPCLRTRRARAGSA